MVLIVESLAEDVNNTIVRPFKLDTDEVGNNQSCPQQTLCLEFLV